MLLSLLGLPRVVPFPHRCLHSRLCVQSVKWRVVELCVENFEDVKRWRDAYVRVVSTRLFGLFAKLVAVLLICGWSTEISGSLRCMEYFIIGMSAKCARAFFNKAVFSNISFWIKMPWTCLITYQMFNHKLDFSPLRYKVLNRWVTFLNFKYVLSVWHVKIRLNNGDTVSRLNFENIF